MNDTLIIFTSDHGDMLGDHNLWRKTYAYEGSAHIPLIVRMPKGMGEPEQKKAEASVTLQDIMPTILDVVGEDIPETVDGTSLKKLMFEPSTQWREYVHGEHSHCYSEEQEMQYLTDGKWKYIWFPRLGTEQLFDLKEDPGECYNLVDKESHSTELLKWRKRLISELEPRDLGLTNGDQLVCQTGEPPIVSPKYQERLERAEYNWTD